MTPNVDPLTGALDELTQQLRDREFAVYPADGTTRPDLLAEHPDFGVIALELGHGDPADEAQVRLNRKVAALRSDFPSLQTAKITRRLIDPVQAMEPSDQILRWPQDRSSAWIDNLPRQPLSDQLRSAFNQAIAPPVVVELPSRGAMGDTGAGARAAYRVRLDEQQSAVVRRQIRDVLLVTGPPGSGKTVILAARARALAERHPDWRIALLCYNRLLVPYLKSILADLPQVEVSTFGKFAHALGFSVSLRDEHQAAADVRSHLTRAEPALEALLIDEWQDFMPAWTELAMALVKPGYGGIALAGDPRQALYRDTAMEAELPRRHVETVTLGIPYRSTQQILDVTSALDPAMEISGKELAPEGEPVDLVWAHSMAEQAAAVARDIELLLDSGTRAPADIAVLVTRKWNIGAVVRILLDNDIPTRAIYANQAETLSLSEPTVKIMTVHSAKGYEFPVVFLVGLEHLAEPDGSERSEREGRSGYVGLTRAKDQLVMTYTRDNTYLERVRATSPGTLRRWVWPDDYREA